MLLDGFNAKEFIFKGFVKFQLFVFTKQSISFKNECEGTFQYYTQVLTDNPFQGIQDWV